MINPIQGQLPLCIFCCFCNGYVLLYEKKSFSLFFFLFLFGCTPDTWSFPGQGSNPSCSFDLSFRSLTLFATMGTPILTHMNRIFTLVFRIQPENWQSTDFHLQICPPFLVVRVDTPLHFYHSQFFTSKKYTYNPYLSKGHNN